MARGLTFLVAAVTAAACSSTRGGIDASAPTLSDSLITAAAESRQFTIYVTAANARQHPAIPLTTEYYVKMDGDSVHSFLPYFGRTYYPDSNFEGYIFDTAATNYTSQDNGRGTTTVSFSARFLTETCKYTIGLFPGGRAYVRVTSNNRASISYEGEMGQ